MRTLRTSSDRRKHSRPNSNGSAKGRGSAAGAVVTSDPSDTSVSIFDRVNAAVDHLDEVLEELAGADVPPAHRLVARVFLDVVHANLRRTLSGDQGADVFADDLRSAALRIRKGIDANEYPERGG